MTGLAKGRRTLLIFGAGSHGREVAWLAREVLGEVEIAFAVDDPQYAGGSVDGTPVRLLSDVSAPPGSAFITAVGDPGLRRRAVDELVARGLIPIALVHPRTVLAPTTSVGEGAMIAAGSVLTDRVQVGPHAIVNVGCTLSHDVRLGAFATISPGVHIAGHVTVETGATLGIGAVVINGTAERPLVIGRDATVGAGAVVIGDVPAGATVAGVPARRLPSGGHP